MKLLLYYLFFIHIALLSCNEENTKKPYNTGMEGKPIPEFAIQLLDSASYLHSQDIPGNKNLILFYYSPTCPYCRAQMREMLENIEIFNDNQLCVLSYADLKSIKQFVNYFNLESIKNIIIGRDTGIVIPKKYGLTNVPFTAYFDMNRNLKVAYSGRLNSNILLKVH